MTHKLLLADDSVTIQRVVELTFADEDIDVTTVGDGQLAIDRLDADPPDIVLADVDMPKRDGYEVAAYVKSRPKLAHIPVVLLTGAFEPIDQARAAASGSNEVLAKPFEPQMVINRVKQLLGRKKYGGNYDVPPKQGQEGAFAPQQALPPRPPARNVTPQDSQRVASSVQSQQAQGESPQGVSLDDYFDQLDAAFSNLQSGTAAPEHDNMNTVDWATADESVPHTQQGAPPQARWVEPLAPPAHTMAPSRPPAPEHLITPPEVIPRPPVAAVRPVATPQAPAPQPRPAPPAPLPVMAKPAPIAAALMPEPPARPTANPFASLSAVKAEAAAAVRPVITDEVIEEVVARVLQRLSDRVVRETVTEIVSQTAERAVQEEIERIKMGGQ